MNSIAIMTFALLVGGALIGIGIGDQQARRRYNIVPVQKPQTENLIWISVILIVIGLAVGMLDSTYPSDWVSKHFEQIRWSSTGH